MKQTARIAQNRCWQLAIEKVLQTANYTSVRSLSEYRGKQVFMNQNVS